MVSLRKTLVKRGESGIAAHLGKGAGMTEKKPQAGEWWEHDGYRVYVVGHRRDGVVITEAIGGFIGCIENELGWKHLPECDSFEWQSPDDWVTQDMVPPRDGIDWYFIENIHLVYVPKKSFDSIMLKHGDIVGDIGMLHVRCRRRDLPQEMPKPNYVRLWTHRTSGTVCTATDERYLKYPDIWTELKHDGTGFYLAYDGK